MSEQLEILTWECDACAGAEGGSGLPCTLTSGLYPADQELWCPISREECEFELVPTASSQQLIKDLRDGLEIIAEGVCMQECNDGVSRMSSMTYAQLQAKAKALIAKAEKK